MKKGDLQILLTLQRYYVDDITLARSAEDAGVSLWHLIDFMARKKLPVVYEEGDAVEGLKKVSRLLSHLGVKGVLEEAKEALTA